MTGGREKMSSDNHGNDPCVLIKGPNWGDAEFYGKWLLAAAQAETFWKEACKDPGFEKQVKRVIYDFCIPDFGISASLMVMRLEEYMTTFVLDLESEESGAFVMMFTMGFFATSNPGYRMAIPSDLTVAKVKGAALKYAETEDEEYVLHPEYLVNTMSFPDARAWQNRLRAVDRFCDSSNVLGRA
jgi:hypothetical protein